MNGKYFIDTNILIYSFDQNDHVKKERANEIIKIALTDGNGFISIQVIREFFNVATRKFTVPMDVLTAKSYLEKVLGQLNVYYPNFDFISTGLDIAATTKYSFYDSLIIAAALKSECSVLFSEDMQHGQKIQGLRIENPFV